jgi:hypothetical protein
MITGSPGTRFFAPFEALQWQTMHSRAGLGKRHLSFKVSPDEFQGSVQLRPVGQSTGGHS